MYDGLVITITGPSLSGKTTFAGELVSSMPSLFERAITYTTRPRRSGERDGVDYYFSWPGLSISLVESNVFGGYTYGLSGQELQRILNAGRVPIVVLDPNGVNALIRWAENKNWEVYSVYTKIDPRVQLERFFDRIRNDACYDPSVYIQRLYAMQNEEATWESRCHYRLFVNEHDGGVSKNTLQQYAEGHLLRRERAGRDEELRRAAIW